MQSVELTHTLSFDLTITTGEPSDLHTGCLEARRIRNETNRLDKHGWDWKEIKSTVVDNADHIKNTSQLIVDKALGELETYHDYKHDDWGRPYPYIDRTYPLVMNHGEGYRLFTDDDSDTVRFRITATRGTHVKGELHGSADHLNRVQTALEDDTWRVGTAEVIHKHGEWRLHITVTHEHAKVGEKHDAETIIGVDINEDCIALAAMSRGGELYDSVVLDYTDVKTQRHEFFTKRKRMQTAKQTAFETTVQTEERDYVHDRLHTVSRRVVEWVSQFERPVLVFEDLKDMRDDIDYGTRMNRRLHSLPFSKLREMVSYKAAWRGVPSDDVDPEYTSQRCPRTECQHTERANRHKNRFKCCECGFQDHADRKAAVCVVQEWVDEQTGNVPSLDRLSGGVEVRRTASGAGGGPDSHGPSGSGVDRYGTSARPETGVREELKSVAPNG